MSCRLTVHSSRTREVPFSDRLAVRFPSASEPRVAGRLNYGVRHMRLSALLLIAFLAGCSHAPARTSSVTSLVTSSAESCDLFVQDHSILLTVHNSGPGKLRVKAQDESGPPFRMAWSYYSILSGTADPVQTYQSPSGHGPLPLATVSIEPNDETQFLLYLPERTPISGELRYRAQFEDLAGQLHYSAPFSLCITGSMPNNAFKPMPLRGTA